MKIQQRFILHLFLGFLVWILLLAATLPVIMEGILPKFGLGGEQYEWIVLPIAGTVTILCLLLFGWYFGSPLILLMKWINQLAQEDFGSLIDIDKIYTRKQKLKMRYRLYKEVVAQFDYLRLQLEKAKVERAQVEAEKRDWIAGVSHDLKTPLTYIKGYATLLLNPKYSWSKAEQHHFIEEMDHKSTHMEQLVQDLNLAMHFDHSQTIPMHKTTHNIVTFMQQVLADVSNDLRAQQHQFELKATMEIQVLFDENLLQRALQNIYMNAIIHNEKPVSIETALFQKGKNVVISIEDNGIGMTIETQKHLFNRYYRGTTTDQNSEGTGLGMAIVKKLIEAHDGQITVESAIQQGTTFTITLPMKENR